MVTPQRPVVRYRHLEEPHCRELFLARGEVLVAHDWLARIKRLEAGQTQTLQLAADGSYAASDHGRNAAHGHAAAPQLLDTLAQPSIQAGAGIGRPRAAIQQAIQALLVEPITPLAGGANADAGHLGRRHQPHPCNAFNQQFSTFKGQSGILMAVHPAGFLCEPEAW
jgi:hypothetical protein